MCIFKIKTVCYGKIDSRVSKLRRGKFNRISFFWKLTGKMNARIASRMIINCMLFRDDFYRNFLFFENKTEQSNVKRIKSEQLVLKSLKTSQWKVPSKYRKLSKVVFEILRLSKRVSLKHLANIHCPYDLSSRTASSKYSVFSFVRSFFRNVLPFNVWGSKLNNKLFHEKILFVINMNIYDSVNVITLVSDFDIHCIGWSCGNLNIVGLFFNFLLFEFLRPLLKTVFYVTENCSCGKSLKYYRKEIWIEISENLILEKLKTSYLKCSDRICSSTLFYGRILPKSNGSSRLVLQNFHEKSKHFAKVLTSLSKLKMLKGFGIHSISEMKEKVIFFRQNIIQCFKDIVVKENFYFVQTDIQNCFDNICKDKLIAILNEISFKYPDVNIKLNTQHIKVSKVLPEIIRFVKSFLETMTATVNNKIYSIDKGVPQGWPLSSALCNLYFGHMENMRFSDVSESQTSLCLRYMDDYLYISTNLKHAEEFYNLIKTAEQEYCFKVNERKTVTNIYKKEKFANFTTFLGFLIPIKMNKFLEGFYFEHKGLVKNEIEISLTYFIGKSVDVNSHLYLSKYIRRKVSMLLLCFDCNLNSNRVVLINLYKVAVIAAKAWMFRKKRFMKINLEQSKGFLKVGSLIKSISKTAVIQIRKKNCYQNFPSFLFSEWLFLTAFERVCKNECLYKEEYKILKSQKTFVNSKILKHCQNSNIINILKYSSLFSNLL